MGGFLLPRAKNPAPFSLRAFDPDLACHRMQVVLDAAEIAR